MYVFSLFLCLCPSIGVDLQDLVSFKTASPPEFVSLADIDEARCVLLPFPPHLGNSDSTMMAIGTKTS